MNLEWAKVCGLDEKSFFELIKEYIQCTVKGMHSGAEKNYCYFSKTGLLNFVKTGCMLEYPTGLILPVPVKDRISMLQFIKNKIEQTVQMKKNETEELAFFILREDRFCVNNVIVFGVGRNNITTYPSGMNDMSLCVIKEHQIVADIGKFMEEYLPNSDMVYSDKRAIEIIQENIDMLMQMKD